MHIRIIYFDGIKSRGMVFMELIYIVYNFLWGDLVTLPLPGGNSIGISLLILILIPLGIYFSIRTKLLPIRLFPDMIRITLEKKTGSRKNSLSGVQALIVSTATRVGMGNMVGVVAAITKIISNLVKYTIINSVVGSLQLNVAFLTALVKIGGDDARAILSAADKDRFLSYNLYIYKVNAISRYSQIITSHFSQKFLTKIYFF